MAYSDILKMKKVEDIKEVRVFVKNLVVGSDIFALDLFQHFDQREKGSTKILSSEKLSQENLKLLGPSMVRGQTNIDIMKSLGIHGEESHSIFYKDMRFHKFGARTKPMKLLWGEEKLTEAHMKVDLKSVVPSLRDDQLLPCALENTLTLSINSIEKSIPEELIEQTFWKLHCSNGTVVECDNLYWGETPASFYELFNNKSEFSANFVTFCESTKTPCALYVHMRLEETITEDKETIFFPLSFTYDWGHFMGEIVKIEGEESAQEARFVTFVDKDESTEEDISKKIRLLKKNFEKNYKKFSTTKCREFVVLKENAYCPKIDDSLLSNEEDFQDRLTFFSFNAPLTKQVKEKDNFEDSWFSSSLMVRALLVQSVVKS